MSAGANSCEQCEALSARNGELERRVAELELEATTLRAQLVEVSKLVELQAADLERYKKAVEAVQVNHPERAPREQLQLAFARVLEMFGGPANVNDNAADEGTSDDASGADQGKPATTGTGKRKKKRHAHGRRPLRLSNLPVIEDRIIPEEVRAANGVGYGIIGEEASERVACRPTEWVCYRIVRVKYKLIGSPDSNANPHDAPASDAVVDSERTTIVIAPLPDAVWPRTMADPSAIARALIGKYGDLLPLNRQQTISARGGFPLPKSTLCGWFKAAHPFCAPVVDASFAEGRAHAFIIATDATGASVRPPQRKADETARPAWSLPDRRECETWHLYVFVADRDHVVFRYHREHNGDVFASMLDGYRGNLLADAASVYDVLYREHGMLEHGCWFHARRPFYRALETEPEPALEALSLIGKLFEIDRTLRADELSLDELTAERAKRSRPVLELFDAWVERHRGRSDPRGRLEAALGYYDNQRAALHRFLGDGRIRLDNNGSERQLRNAIIGQANWTFFQNETGLRWYTTFRSLIASCALHRLNPELYLEQLLRLAPHWPKTRALELAPKYWAQTVASLDARHHAILARPWEPGVVLSAQLPDTREAAAAITRAA